MASPRQGSPLPSAVQSSGPAPAPAINSIATNMNGKSSPAAAKQADGAATPSSTGQQVTENAVATDADGTHGPAASSPAAKSPVAFSVQSMLADGSSSAPPSANADSNMQNHSGNTQSADNGDAAAESPAAMPVAKPTADGSCATADVPGSSDSGPRGHVGVPAQCSTGLSSAKLPPSDANGASKSVDHVVENPATQCIASA